MPNPKEFFIYAKEHYTRTSEVTLVLNDKNLREAWAVYEAGVTSGATRRSAVIAVYGYRYRRMENFLADIQAYKPGAGWVAKKYICRASWFLVSPGGKKKEKRIDFELTFEIIVPLGWKPSDAINFVEIDKEMEDEHPYLYYAWIEGSTMMDLKCSFDQYIYTFFPVNQKWHLVITIDNKDYEIEGWYEWKPYVLM